MTTGALLWWRVEFDRDGGVLRCDEVEQPERDGRLVRYVEAASREAATTEAVGWVERRRADARRCYERKKAAGLCVKAKKGCLKTPEPGAVSCRVCAEYAATIKQQVRARRASGDATDRRRKYATAEEARAAAKLQREAFAKRRAQAVKQALRVQEPDWLAMPYREAIALFDKLGPKLFRAWLVEGAEQAEAAARPLAAE